jgi:hypothetical protein
MVALSSTGVLYADSTERGDAGSGVSCGVAIATDIVFFLLGYVSRYRAQIVSAKIAMRANRLLGYE